MWTCRDRSQQHCLAIEKTILGDRLAACQAVKVASSAVQQVVAEDGSLGWSEVYLFPHFETGGAHAFLRIFTAGNAKVLSSILLPY